MTGPGPDRTKAPYTGWGRQHWETAADEQISAAWRHSSPAGAQVRFPSEREQDDVDLLEGFARTFLLAALRLAGASGQLGGSMADTAHWYARALAAGTDPQSPERWPELTDHGQATVEATAVVLGLHFSRPWVWDTVPQRVRDNTAAWLAGSAQSFGADNNHVMFAAMEKGGVLTITTRGLFTSTRSLFLICWANPTPQDAGRCIGTGWPNLYAATATSSAPMARR